MSYPENKPDGNYKLREYDFATDDDKKLVMNDYIFKHGYRNAEESPTESVPDAHNKNWFSDLIHRNLRYTQLVAEENKKLLAEKVATPTSIGQVRVGYGLEVAPDGTLSVIRGVAEDANIISYDLPVGSYMYWSGKNPPSYFIFPDGKTIYSNTEYPELWSFAQENDLISPSDDPLNEKYIPNKLYGINKVEGGTTYFKAFDLTNKFIKSSDGTDIGKMEEAGLPNIEGKVGNLVSVNSSAEGAFKNLAGSKQGWGGQSATGKAVEFKASYSNSIYGKSDTVTPANVALRLVLKAKPTPPEKAVPIGTIMDYTGKTAPAGYTICDGKTLSISQFNGLYEWAVTNGLMKEEGFILDGAPHAYYVKVGTTHFKIPDLRGVFKRNADLASNRGGVELGAYQEDGLPNITGQVGAVCFRSTSVPGTKGCMSIPSYGYSNFGSQSSWINGTVKIDASSSNPIYGKANQVQPKSVSVIPILKY